MTSSNEPGGPGWPGEPGGPQGTPGGYGEPPSGGWYGQPPSGGYGQPGQSPPGSYGPPAGYPGYPGGYGSSGYPAARPSNYLVWAILSTIFCFWPTGIPAIVFAAQVNSKFNQGDFQGAQDYSRKARLFTIISACVGIALIIIVVIAAAVTSNHTPSSGY